MFRATDSPILRSNFFDCIYSFWYNAPTLLPIGAVAPVGSSVGALYQTVYTVKKVLLMMGKFVARNM